MSFDDNYTLFHSKAKNRLKINVNDADIRIIVNMVIQNIAEYYNVHRYILFFDTDIP